MKVTRKSAPDVSVSGDTLNVPSASAKQRGVLLPRDYVKFSAKLSDNLDVGHLFIGNKSNKVHRVTLGGDITMNDFGLVHLKDMPVNPGLYKNPGSIEVDQKGRVVHVSNGTRLDPGCVWVGNNYGDADAVEIAGDLQLDPSNRFELSRTGVVPGKYHNPVITVDDKGRIEKVSQGLGSSTRLRPGVYTNPVLVVGDNGAIEDVTSEPKEFVAGSRLDLTALGKDASVTEHKGAWVIDLPTASATARGLLSPEDYARFDNKDFTVMGPGGKLAKIGATDQGLEMVADAAGALVFANDAGSVSLTSLALDSSSDVLTINKSVEAGHGFLDPVVRGTRLGSKEKPFGNVWMSGGLYRPPPVSETRITRKNAKAFANGLRIVEDQNHKLAIAGCKGQDQLELILRYLVKLEQRLV